MSLCSEEVTSPKVAVVRARGGGGLLEGTSSAELRQFSRRSVRPSVRRLREKLAASVALLWPFVCRLETCLFRV